MFYKIPLGTDLSKTSYRCYKGTDVSAYIEYNQGHVGEDWVELSYDELVSELGEDPFDEQTIEESSLTEEEIYQAEIMLTLAKISARQNEQAELLSTLSTRLEG